MNYIHPVLLLSLFGALSNEAADNKFMINQKMQIIARPLKQQDDGLSEILLNAIAGRENVTKSRDGTLRTTIILPVNEKEFEQRLSDINFGISQLRSMSRISRFYVP